MKKWTTRELSILKEEYPTGDLDNLAYRFGCSVGAVKAAASHANLKRKKHKKRAAIKHRIPPKQVLLRQKEILEGLLKKRKGDKFIAYKLEAVKNELEVLNNEKDE